MNKPEECIISYLGYKNPKTKEELQFLILGLKTAAAKINLKISELEQSSFLADAALSSGAEDINDFFGVKNECLHSKDGKGKENREKN